MPQDHSPASIPGRDGRNALLLLAVVGVALVAGYRGGAPADAPAEPAHQAAVYSAPTLPPTAGYDLNKAMALAGNEVPSSTESYYFFAFVDETPAEQEAADLAEKLQQASREHDFLGVAGPDADRNRRALLSALAGSSGKDLSGVVIIYVGPRAQMDEVTQAVTASGAQLRYVVYPDLLPDLKPEV